MGVLSHKHKHFHNFMHTLNVLQTVLLRVEPHMLCPRGQKPTNVKLVGLGVWGYSRRGERCFPRLTSGCAGPSNLSQPRRRRPLGALHPLVGFGALSVPDGTDDFLTRAMPPGWVVGAQLSPPYPGAWSRARGS